MMTDSFGRREFLTMVGLGGIVAPNAYSAVSGRPIVDTDHGMSEQTDVPVLEETIGLSLSEAKQLTGKVMELGTQLFGGKRCEGAIRLGSYQGENRYVTIVSPLKENDNNLVIGVCLGLD